MGVMALHRSGWLSAASFEGLSSFSGRDEAIGMGISESGFTENIWFLASCGEGPWF